ncbi:MAG: terminase small subunit [Saprospiraceae bacterium]
MEKDKTKKQNPKKNIVNKIEGKPRTYKQNRNPPKNTGVINGVDLNPMHKDVLNEWFTNGYNKSKAVMVCNTKVKSQTSAVHIFNAIAGGKEAKKYISHLQSQLRSSNHISREQVLNELVQWSFTDISDLMNDEGGQLTPQQFKELPPAVRRAVQSYKINERTEVDRAGNDITIKTIDIKLVSKLDAMKETAKIIGAYEIDNNQKRGITDLTDVSQEAQKALFNAINLINKDKEANKNN